MPGAGPVKVVTDKAILEPDADTGELVLAALYPGVDGRTRCAPASAGRSGPDPRSARSSRPRRPSCDCSGTCSIPIAST